MIDDVDDLVGEEPDVEGVQDAARARHREPELEVALGVPREGANPPVGADAPPTEGERLAMTTMTDPTHLTRRLRTPRPTTRQPVGR